MTDDPVGPTLRRLAVPMMLGMLSFMLFNLVDTFFVGRLGPDALAAMAFTFPVVFVVMSLSAGLGAGGSAVIARAAGAGQHDRVQRLSTHVILLALLVVIVTAGLGLLFIDPIFRALGAEGEVLALIRDYMEVWLAGMAFVVVPMTGNAALRALGDTKTPARIMATGALLNVVLDPIFIFGFGPVPAMGLRGAAIATVLSFAILFLASAYVFIAREHLLRMPTRHILTDWRSIMHIAGPAVLTMMLVPLASAWVTRLAAGISIETVAALGVASRVEGMAVLGINALAAVITPFMGQNLGAGHRDRIEEGRRYASGFSLKWGLVAAVLIAALAWPLSLAFSPDPATQAQIRLILWIVPITYGAAGILQLAASASNGLGRPGDAVLLNVFRLVVATGIIATIAATMWGGLGLFIGIALGNILAGVFALWRLRRTCMTCRRADAPEAAPAVEVAT